MKKFKINKASGLMFALSPLFIASKLVAADINYDQPLFVNQSDCGATVCVDRRNLTEAQVKQRLTKTVEASSFNAKKSGKSKDVAGQGIGTKSETQIVYLNFEQSSPVFYATLWGGVTLPFVSHQYTQQERDAIQGNIEKDYQGFDITFTQQKPTVGEFSSLNFECQNDGQPCIDFDSGILFGRAQSIDIQNVIRDDVAFVDAGLWEVLAQLDPSGGFFASVSGVPIENNDVQAALSTAVVNQASNTGAHELGHNLGLRHHDSFGSPGTGIPTTGVPSPYAFYPVFDGLMNGDEAVLHTMASGASVGSSLTDSTLRDRFLSERSVIKLVSAQRDRLVSEKSVSGGNKKVHLRKVVAPNTILEGENAGGKLDIREALIRGEISQLDEVDSYRFKAKAGEYISAEFNGFDVPVGAPVIGAIDLYFEESDGSLTLVAQNYQNFEGFDAFLIDAYLEKGGDYILKVSSPNNLSLGYDSNGQPQLLPLVESGYGVLRTGDYNLSIYAVDGKPGKGPGHVPG